MVAVVNELLARRAALLATAARLGDERAKREAEVDAAMGSLRAKRDALLKRVLRAEAEVADLAAKVERVKQAIVNARREENAARNHLRSVRK